ncbi:hypothetical protein COOONC_06844 [Cooperia oncophora]
MDSQRTDQINCELKTLCLQTRLTAIHLDSLFQQDHQVTFDDVEKMVQKLEKEWNMLTIQDVVWNHAAKNAKWLQCWSIENTKFTDRRRRATDINDMVYHHFGREVSEGKWASRGVPEVVDNVHHTNAIEYILRTEVLPKIRLHEFFQVNVEENVKKFEEMARAQGPSSEPLDEFLPIAQDPEWRRFGSSVDWDKAMRIFNRNRDDASSEDDRIAKCVDAFTYHLHYLNGEAGKEAWEILMAGLRAMMGHIYYQRLADDGPKYGAVTPKHKLTTESVTFYSCVEKKTELLLFSYFLQTEPLDSWEEEEKLAFDPDRSRYLMAFNGWVMCHNPLENFALPNSQVYLRRELVCWGDSIKLNYGEKPEDCPYLWQYMKEYTCVYYFYICFY